MRILMVNKFLYPNGGSETYIFKLGEYLQCKGHEVSYFGMQDSRNIVGNNVDAYTTNMDFHGGKKHNKMKLAIKTIYSVEARNKIKLVLEEFKPDIVHLNNFNYQLTPSIILEIKKYEKTNKHPIKIVFTAHDYQLICPNHMMNIPKSHRNCEKCSGGHFENCIRQSCIHESKVKSLIGCMEAVYWNKRGTYRYIDKIICPTNFMKEKMNLNSLFQKKTIVINNFVEPVNTGKVTKKEYILYFGRYSTEKGIDTLLQVCKELSNIQFIFAGKGPIEYKIQTVTNVDNVGFQTGDKLKKLIREAKFTICPSEWYENCPFSVIESQMYGTPVLGANIGGIPELIEENSTGELFESGNARDLKEKIENLWNNKLLIEEYSNNCINYKFETIDDYYHKLMKIYQEEIE